MNAPSLKGLYLILDERWSAQRLLVDVLKAAAAGGATIFQYRNKTLPGAEAYRHAAQLRQVAADVHALFIVNDRCDLALAVDADGVHVGQDDLPLDLARGIMGPEKLIGISTHRPQEVVEATQGGADYIGFGPIFSTDTKPDHQPPVGVDGLRTIRSLTPLPVFAIGGITQESVREIKAAGANGVAVASAVLQASDVEQAVRQMITHLS